jgi:hypothetical protein
MLMVNILHSWRHIHKERILETSSSKYMLWITKFSSKILRAIYIHASQIWGCLLSHSIVNKCVVTCLKFCQWDKSSFLRSRVVAKWWLLCLYDNEVKQKAVQIAIKSDTATSFEWRPGGMTQIVESLPSKHEGLNSNPTTIKKKLWVVELNLVER